MGHSMQVHLRLALRRSFSSKPRTKTHGLGQDISPINLINIETCHD